MSNASLVNDDEGECRLSGDIDFFSVPRVWPKLAGVIERRHELSVSLADVEHANSAALAMLIEALDHGRRHGCLISFKSIPSALLDLAAMSGCDDLLKAGSR